MTRIYDEYVKTCLDKHAPHRRIKIRCGFKFGLTKETKKKMKERDKTRAAAVSASGNERNVLMTKYKSLRNSCNRLVRRDSRDATAKKIMQSPNPTTIWGQVREIINPKSTSNTIRLRVDQMDIIEEKDIANHFNDFFVKKVQSIRVSLKGFEIEQRPSNYGRSPKKLSLQPFVS